MTFRVCLLNAELSQGWHSRRGVLKRSSVIGGMYILALCIQKPAELLATF